MKAVALIFLLAFASVNAKPTINYSEKRSIMTVMM
jgi:hypothetical protein